MSSTIYVSRVVVNKCSKGVWLIGSDMDSTAVRTTVILRDNHDLDQTLTYIFILMIICVDAVIPRPYTHTWEWINTKPCIGCMFVS